MLAFNEYFETALYDFDEKLGKKGRLWLVNTISPVGRNNLLRYSEWMNDLNPVAIFDGGWQAPMGREKQIQEFSQEYLDLPVGDYKKIEIDKQSVYLHSRLVNGYLYFYLVNITPTKKIVSVSLNCDCDIFSLKERKPLATSTIEVRMNSFSVKSFFVKKNASVKNIDVANEF